MENVVNFNALKMCGCNRSVMEGILVENRVTSRKFLAFHRGIFLMLRTSHSRCVPYTCVRFVAIDLLLRTVYLEIK
jgi:hypothetical protein